MNLRFLDHPNIIKYYGVCYIDNMFTLVLQLSPDGALDEVLQSSVMTDAAIFTILLDFIS